MMVIVLKLKSGSVVCVILLSTSRKGKYFLTSFLFFLSLSLFFYLKKYCDVKAIKLLLLLLFARDVIPFYLVKGIKKRLVA